MPNFMKLVLLCGHSNYYFSTAFKIYLIETVCFYKQFSQTKEHHSLALSGNNCHEDGCVLGSARLHGVTTQKTAIFMLATMKT
jgi:hypothetical protein